MSPSPEDVRYLETAYDARDGARKALDAAVRSYGEKCVLAHLAERRLADHAATPPEECMAHTPTTYGRDPAEGSAPARVLYGPDPYPL